LDRWRCDRERRTKVRLSYVVIGSLLLAAGCGGTTVSDERARVHSLAEVSSGAWVQLATERIFFGHQSVGANIVQGISDLNRSERGLNLNLIPEQKVPTIVGAFFADRNIGENGFPAGKTDEFAKLIEGDLGPRLDVAFHKYCYVDIEGTTDIAKVFEHYTATMSRLKQRFPGITFVHVTTPVTRVQSGPKAAIKKLLGKQPDNYANNMQRERFNDLLRQQYGGREPLFDLAAAESTWPDGHRETVSFGGSTFHALVPDYATEDGAHLNELGRRRMAEELLVFLAGLVSPK
jgi:hypothetical protein